MISVERIRADIEALAAFGAHGQGVDRPAYSPAYRAAVDWLADRMREAGMKVREDAAGNLIGRIGPADGPAVISGSHIDSVPNGGKYDGTLGVLAALEVARCIGDAVADLHQAFEVIAFADEEGAFLGELGCRAMTGDLSYEELAETRGRDSGSPVEAMRGYGLDARRIDEAARPPSDFSAYVELHIEQGPVLEERRIDIGIVTGIVGLQVTRVTFIGEANHAGTTPVPLRRDAVRAAAHMVTEAFARLERDFSLHRHRLTYGAMHVAPGASNVVPDRAILMQEIRAGEENDIDSLHAMTLEVAAEVAGINGVEFDIQTLSRDSAARMSPHLMNLIERHAGESGCTSMHMLSGAGHDAQVMAGVTATGMIFIPSAGGVSHNPAEYSTEEHIGRGAEVLRRVVEELVTR